MSNKLVMITVKKKYCNSFCTCLFAETHSSLTVGTTHHSPSLPSLTNKLSKLTLATFDEEGHCIGQMGSWSFSY